MTKGQREDCSEIRVAAGDQSTWGHLWALFQWEEEFEHKSSVTQCVFSQDRFGNRLENGLWWGKAGAPQRGQGSEGERAGPACPGEQQPHKH